MNNYNANNANLRFQNRNSFNKSRNFQRKPKPVDYAARNEKLVECLENMGFKVELTGIINKPTIVFYFDNIPYRLPIYAYNYTLNIKKSFEENADIEYSFNIGNVPKHIDSIGDFIETTCELKKIGRLALKGVGNSPLFFCGFQTIGDEKDIPKFSTKLPHLMYSDAYVQEITEKLSSMGFDVEEI